MARKIFFTAVIISMIISSNLAFAMMGSRGGGSSHMNTQQHDQYMNTQQHDQHMTNQNSYYSPRSAQSAHQDMVETVHNQGTINHEYMDHETMNTNESHHNDAEHFFHD